MEIQIATEFDVSTIPIYEIAGPASDSRVLSLVRGVSNIFSRQTRVSHRVFPRFTFSSSTKRVYTLIRHVAIPDEKTRKIRR